MNRHDSLPDVFQALADPHRRQIMAWLRAGPLGVSALVERLPLSQPGVTKHLGVLERAGLIRRTSEGRERRCSLAPEGLMALDAWLSDYRVFWTGALDRIARMAEEGPEHERDDADDPDRDDRIDRDDSA